MSRITATHNQFGINIHKIVLIPVFICIAKDEIKRSFKLLNKNMGICKPCIDIIRKTGLRKIPDCRFMAGFIFSEMDSVDSHAFNNAFAVGATIDKGFIGTRLDLALLTGEETAGQVSWDLFGDIKLGTFDRIKFEPEISFFFDKEIMAYYELGGPGQS